MAFINLDKPEEFPIPNNDSEFEQDDFMKEYVGQIGDFMELNPINFENDLTIETSRVKIINEAYRLCGSAYPDYIEALTDHIDNKIKHYKNNKEG
jgi:hypothetical protein